MAAARSPESHSHSRDSASITIEMLHFGCEAQVTLATLGLTVGGVRNNHVAGGHQNCTLYREPVTVDGETVNLAELHNISEEQVLTGIIMVSQRYRRQAADKIRVVTELFQDHPQLAVWFAAWSTLVIGPMS